MEIIFGIYREWVCFITGMMPAIINSVFFPFWQGLLYQIEDMKAAV